MKSAAFLLFASLSVVACGGGTADPDPVTPTGDSGDDAVSEEVAADSGSGDVAADTAEEDVADTGADAGKLTCPGSEAEPNDTRVTAAKLKDIDDCDGSGGTIKGIVAGGADSDWFTFAGSDTTLCRVDVVASTKSGVRL